MKKIFRKFDKELDRALRFAIKTSKKVIPVIALAICEQALENLGCDVRHGLNIQYGGQPKRPYSYGDAVGAISASNMYTGDKARAISAVKRDESPDYYDAIVAIVRNGTMYTGDKVRAIKNLGERGDDR